MKTYYQGYMGKEGGSLSINKVNRRLAKHYKQFVREGYAPIVREALNTHGVDIRKLRRSGLSIKETGRVLAPLLTGPGHNLGKK